jgi:hypothetical protein
MEDQESPPSYNSYYMQIKKKPKHISPKTLSCKKQTNPISKTITYLVVTLSN